MTSAETNNGDGRGLGRVLGVLAGVLLVVLLMGTCLSIRRSAETAASMREVVRIRDAWRDFVRECPTGKTWRMVDGAFVAGPLKAEVGPGRVTFRRDVGEKVLALPPGVRAELGIDQVQGIAPAAVLTLRWTSSRVGLKRQHVVPVVACAEPRVQSKGFSGIGP